jgi:hypothetical protein
MNFHVYSNFEPGAGIESYDWSICKIPSTNWSITRGIFKCVPKTLLFIKAV